MQGDASRSPADWHETEPAIRQLQIIVAAIVVGAVAFLVVVLVQVRPIIGLAAGQGMSLLTQLALASTIPAIAAYIFVPAIMARVAREQARNVHELMKWFFVRTIVTVALLEGTTFFLIIAYLVEGSIYTIVTAIPMIFVLALHFPRRERVVLWIKDQLRAIDDDFALRKQR